MPQKFYTGNYGGPLSVDVFAADGETPILPLSATIDILNMTSGVTIVSSATCLVASGLAAYVIPSGSPATLNPGRYVGYIDVLIEAGNMQTEEVYFNVYAKTSYLIIERWKAKVQDSALDDVHIDDDAAREWIDQAVGWLSLNYGLGYSSVLGAITPAPTNSDTELIASVASLMARAAWWSGKGNWRDAEMSFNGTPFETEWLRIATTLQRTQAEGWFTDPIGGDTYNRDHVYYQGKKYDSPLYWERDSTDPVPDTEIPI